MTLPKHFTISRQALVPGRTTSRASWSASMTIAPHCLNIFATVLFPVAMPPVSPTTIMQWRIAWDPWKVVEPAVPRIDLKQVTPVRTSHATDNDDWLYGGLQFALEWSSLRGGGTSNRK